MPNKINNKGRDSISMEL